MTASFSISSPPTSESTFQFLTRDGTPLARPPEWIEGYIRLGIDPERWNAVRFYRNDIAFETSLRTIGTEDMVVADWPLSGTGHYNLRLETPGDEPHEAVWTVEPRKISPDSFLALLDELENRLPVSIAIALQRLGAIAGVELLPPSASTLAQEMTRLRRAITGTSTRPGLAASLAHIARDPHRILARTETWVSRERARRVHPTFLRKALGRARNLDDSGIPVQLPELRTVPTVDVFENRLIKTFYDQVHKRLRRIFPVVVRRNQVLAEEAASLGDVLAAGRRRARFLEDVGRLAQAPDTLTMVLLKRPDYRAAFEGFIEFHRSAATRLENPGLDSPLEELPRLFEIWGTLNVIDAVLTAGIKRGYELVQHQLIGQDAGGVFVRVLPDGRTALALRHPKDETVISVRPQASYTRTSDPLYSVSYTQRPDVAVEIDRPSGRRHLAIFDPKYKLESEADTFSGRPKKIDIDAMHAYRDAIRDASDARPVMYASILYPGPYIRFGTGIAALPARPDQPQPLQEHIEDVLNAVL